MISLSKAPIKLNNLKNYHRLQSSLLIVTVERFCIMYYYSLNTQLPYQKLFFIFLPFFAFTQILKILHYFARKLIFTLMEQASLKVFTTIG